MPALSINNRGIKPTNQKALMSVVISSQIQLWRQKVADGTITTDELREAIAAIRKERVGSSEKSAVSRAKAAPKPKINADDVLAKFSL